MFARHLTTLAVSLAALAVVGFAANSPATAASGASTYKSSGYKTKSKNRRYYSAKRRKPQVRAYVTRRGGYSFDRSDTINTTVGTRSLFGGTNVFRDRQLDSQTISGPFDHGFFFDSPIGNRGGDSPYHQ